MRDAIIGQAFDTASMETTVDRLIAERGGNWTRCTEMPDSGSRGSCEPIHREIYGPDISREGTAAFAVWLHEIGHSYQHVGSDRFWHNPVPYECQAWEWAITAAPIWTAEMQNEMTAGLYQYLDDGSHPQWSVGSNVDRVLKTIAMGQNALSR